MKNNISFLIRCVLFGLTLFIFYQVTRLPASPAIDYALLLGGVLLVFPIVWIGRILLNRQPASHSAWIVTFVHFLLMALFGSAVFRAIVTHRQWPDWKLPVPEEIGMVLVIVSGAALLLTVFNLALKGFGAPFAVALSRKLAVDWMYAWTRNPMALALLAFLLALGIWFQSALFVLWILFLATPAWLAFLIIFEERELEMRFGSSYLEYKSKTPRFFPRRPRC